ncbi:MAG: hypothetical protein KAR39_07020 [Thermoplasmata archaeon]|nr:hypothetical protein [Thermoplasmata archaeon]
MPESVGAVRTGNVIMGTDERKIENEKLKGDIIELMDRRMSLTRKLHNYIEGTFSGIQTMTAIAYGLGIFLIVSSVLYYFLTEQRLEVLGFSALGSAEMVAIFLYQPMQRVQNALGDFSQHTVVLHAWNTQVALKMLHMRIDDEASAKEACEYIRDITKDYAETIERLTERHE